MSTTLLPPSIRRLVELALEEDVGRGDITTNAVVGNNAVAGNQVDQATGHVVAREPLVVSGCLVADYVFRYVNDSISVEQVAVEGDRLATGDVLMRVTGLGAGILIAERTALNFLQRLCGIATLSSRFAQAVSSTSAAIVDTRKTTPGFRTLEKDAVRAGGCRNHRFDLASGVLIKDNHIALCGSVTEAIRRARKNAPHPLRIEVEVDRLDQLKEALTEGVDIVLVDNMAPEQVSEAVAMAHQAGALVEVSGGITLETVLAYAQTGADFLSVGALTHSARAVDIALEVHR